jgi:DNA invertase Pin-like site-specific DNA recombinase
MAHRLPEHVDAAIRTRLLAGQRVATIVRELGVSKGTVESRARTWGIATRPRGGVPRIPAEIVRAIREAVERGDPILHIAERFSVSRPTVRRLARERRKEVT